MVKQLRRATEKSPTYLWWLSRCDNLAAFSGGTARTSRLGLGEPVRRCTRRYAAQRDASTTASEL